MREDAKRWNERYAATAAPRARPPEALEHWPDLTALLPAAGRAVDIASGPGQVTLWLAEQGLGVTALDASSAAVDLLDSAAAAAGLSTRVDARVVDLDDGLPEDLHDVDLIVCQRFRDTALYGTIIARLRPGGLAIVTVLSTVEAPEPGPFRALEGELLQAFGSDPRCEVIRERERDGIAHLVAQRL